MTEHLYKGKRAWFEYPGIRHFAWNPYARRFDPAPETSIPATASAPLEMQTELLYPEDSEDICPF